MATLRTLTSPVPLVPPPNFATFDQFAIRMCRVDDAIELACLYFSAYDAGEACDSLEEATEDIAMTFGGEYGPLMMEASLVAVAPGDQLCGAVLVVESAPWDDVPDCPFIIELFTAREHRRRGVARELLRRSAEILAGKGHASVGLRVIPENTAAIRLYGELGFSDWKSP